MRCWSHEEADKLLDQEQRRRAKRSTPVENNGIVFLDEIDKICARVASASAATSAAKACSAICCR